MASNVRKGNVIEKDGKLYIVLTAENIHPGKGTPVTQLEMRRISDGTKINERYKTTDQLEKAFVEYKTHNYLYQEGDHFIFMDPETFDLSRARKCCQVYPQRDGRLIPVCIHNCLKRHSS